MINFIAIVLLVEVGALLWTIPPKWWSMSRLIKNLKEIFEEWKMHR